MNTYPQSQQHPSQGGINPAMLANLSTGGGQNNSNKMSSIGQGINPAQLMNGMFPNNMMNGAMGVNMAAMNNGMGNMGAATSGGMNGMGISPSQILQQQQHLSTMNNGMASSPSASNFGLGMMGSGGGIPGTMNPAQLMNNISNAGFGGSQHNQGGVGTGVNFGLPNLSYPQQNQMQMNTSFSPQQLTGGAPFNFNPTSSSQPYPSQSQQAPSHFGSQPQQQFPSQPHQFNSQSQHASAMPTPMGMSMPNPGQPSQSTTIDAVLGSLGLTREVFMNLPPDQKATYGRQAQMAYNQQLQQQMNMNNPQFIGSRGGNAGNAGGGFNLSQPPGGNNFGGGAAPQANFPPDLGGSGSFNGNIAQLGGGGGQQSMSHQRTQSFNGIGASYDRPPSASSHHSGVGAGSNTNNILQQQQQALFGSAQPHGSRPGTAQSRDRPGTGQSQTAAQSPAPSSSAGPGLQQHQPPSTPVNPGGPRPPSAIGNGYPGMKPSTPQATSASGMNNNNPYPDGISTPIGANNSTAGFGSASPHRGAKRKLPPTSSSGGGMDSPRIGHGPGPLAGAGGMVVGGAGTMGPPPPVLSRQISAEQNIGLGNVNGYPTAPGTPGGGGAGAPRSRTHSAASGIAGFPGNNNNLTLSINTGGMGPAGLDLQNMPSSIGRQTSVPPTSAIPPPSPMKPPNIVSVGIKPEGHTGSLPAAAVVGGGVTMPVPPLPLSAQNSSQGAASNSAPSSAPASVPVPMLPPGVSVDPEVSALSVVPASSLQPLSDEEIAQVKEWKKKDDEYRAAYINTKQRMAKEVRDELGASSARWWERGGRGGMLPDPASSAGGKGRRPMFDVRYPGKRPKSELISGSRGKGKTRREGLKIPGKIDPHQASLPERLVPIRLEFDVNHHKMRETFVININDPIVTPHHFAQSLVEDYALAPSFHNEIVKYINDQIGDYKAHSLDYDPETGDAVAPEAPAPLISGKLEEGEQVWWEMWRKSLMDDYHASTKASRRKKELKARKKRKTEGIEDVEEVESGKVEESLSLGDLKDDGDEDKGFEDMRILIKLDIVVGTVKLDDQFEWDIDNDSSSPEEFAEVYAQDLGLGGEFKTAIAHCIREQVHTYQKSLFLVGHPSDGSAIQDDELRMSFLPSVSSAARPMDQVQSFTPLLNQLSESDIERSEKEREKEMNKRRKRQNRYKRGVALPDREPIRTYRTPGIGFPELNAAALAVAAAAAAPMSRRAAAAAASLSIANMVASESHGDNYVPLSTPLQAQQPTLPASNPLAAGAKSQKKPKGLFQPPEYDRDAVMRLRASIVAPTPSTGIDKGDEPRLDGEASTSMGLAPPDSSRSTRVMSAKRAKELEREAKEKEYADGQHPNMIDGVWHCSNCGCPENIAIGRRKGPLGDKSQCGVCGKYWHRHRKPRPVEYNTDPDYHLNLQQEPENAKTTARRRGRGGQIVSTPAEEPSEPQTPIVHMAEIDAPPAESSAPEAVPEPDRPISPMSSASSTSEAPLAEQVRINGTNHSVPSAPAMTRSASSQSSTVTASLTNNNQPQNTPPEWLLSAMAGLQSRFPHDLFETTMRKVAGAMVGGEWRIKCLDCPGKLYTPGPGETLSNFEVHLKNRQHRQRVGDRTHK